MPAVGNWEFSLWLARYNDEPMSRGVNLVVQCRQGDAVVCTVWREILELIALQGIKTLKLFHISLSVLYCFRYLCVWNCDDQPSCLSSVWFLKPSPVGVHYAAKSHQILAILWYQWSVLQVAQELAECISLPDGTTAQLSVARSLAKADSVSIEPYSEDDWEILESRADLAEETILKQVFFAFSFFFNMSVILA